MSKAVTAEEYFESATMQGLAGDRAAAIVQLQESLMLRPDYDLAWNNRGNFLLQLGHPFDAMLHYDKAIEINDRIADYHNNRGAAFSAMSKYDEAYGCYDYALKLRPSFDEALINLANIENLRGNRAKAIEGYKKALVANPKHALARLTLSFALLEAGMMKEGWVEFESRWKSGQIPERGLEIPRWKGESLKGKKLLIYAEQGNGDCLQFVRYAPLVKKKYGGIVIVEVRQAMTRLVKTLRGIDQVHIFGDRLPEGIDYCVPMMSVPGIVGTDTEADIPWFGTYFHIERDAVLSWKEKLNKLLPPRPIRVGVCWAGMSRPHQPIAHETDRRRSMALADMAQLARVQGIAWVSLQKGPPAEQVMSPPQGMTIGTWSDDIDDFYDTAALIENLDLVISVDTAVAHLAGALGKPVWMLSRFDGCWRWMGDRPDSPWYPSLTQFRQKTPGDWGSVMEPVALQLKKFVEEHTATAVA